MDLIASVVECRDGSQPPLSLLRASSGDHHNGGGGGGDELSPVRTCSSPARERSATTSATSTPRLRPKRVPTRRGEKRVVSQLQQQYQDSVAKERPDTGNDGRMSRKASAHRVVHGSVEASQAGEQRTVSQYQKDGTHHHHHHHQQLQHNQITGQLRNCLREANDNMVSSEVACSGNDSIEMTKSATELRGISSLLRKVCGDVELLHAKVDRIEDMLGPVPGPGESVNGGGRTKTFRRRASTFVDILHSLHSNTNSPAQSPRPRPPPPSAASSAEKGTAIRPLTEEADLERGTPVSTPRKRKRFMQLGLTDVRHQKSFRFAKQLTSRISVGSGRKRGVGSNDISDGGGVVSAPSERSMDTYSQPMKKVLVHQSSVDDLGLRCSAAQSEQIMYEKPLLPAPLASSDTTSEFTRRPSHLEGRRTSLNKFPQAPLPVLPGCTMNVSSNSPSALPHIRPSFSEPVSQTAVNDMKRASITTAPPVLRMDVRTNHGLDRMSHEPQVHPAASASSLPEDLSGGDADYAIMSISTRRPSCTLSHASFLSDCFPACTGSGGFNTSSSHDSDSNPTAATTTGPRSPFIQLPPADATRTSPLYQRISSRASRILNDGEASSSAAVNDVNGDAAAPSTEQMPHDMQSSKGDGDYDRVSRNSIFSEAGAAGGNSNHYSSPLASTSSLPIPSTIYSMLGQQEDTITDQAAKENFRKTLMAMCDRMVRVDSTQQAEVQNLIGMAHSLGLFAATMVHGSNKVDSMLLSNMHIPGSDGGADDIIYDENYDNDDPELTSLASEDCISQQSYPAKKRFPSIPGDPYSVSPRFYSSAADGTTIQPDEQQLHRRVAAASDAIYLDERSNYISAAALQRVRSCRRPQLDSTAAQRHSSVVSQSSVFASVAPLSNGASQQKSVRNTASSVHGYPTSPQFRTKKTTRLHGKENDGVPMSSSFQQPGSSKLINGQLQSFNFPQPSFRRRLNTGNVPLASPQQRLR